MRILGIETSCDETSAAIYDGRTLLSSVVSSQIPLHRKYAGVVPEIASRAHCERINDVIQAAMQQAGIAWSAVSGEISAVAYTRGPGLAGSLLVGQVAAQTISLAAGIPLIGVNHMEGHICGVVLEYPRIRLPFVCLIASGGHTDLVVVKEIGSYTVLGGTRDDAAGEAFDKVARLLGLPYPGGPAVEACARRGDPARFSLPRPYLPGSWDFSFSGLKTAVVNIVKTGGPRVLRGRADICAAFQNAVADTLVHKLLRAAAAHGISSVALAGGVAANTRVRELLTARAAEKKYRVYIPRGEWCTDNAAMIAAAGWYRFSSGMPVSSLQESIEPGMSLKSWR